MFRPHPVSERWPHLARWPPGRESIWGQSSADETGVTICKRQKVFVQRARILWIAGSPARSSTGLVLDACGPGGVGVLNLQRVFELRMPR